MFRKVLVANRGEIALRILRTLQEMGIAGVLVSPGDEVETHQPLLVVEAMKMQLEIKAPPAGRVANLLAAEGEQVEAGVPLVELVTGS